MTLLTLLHPLNSLLPASSPTDLATIFSRFLFFSLLLNFCSAVPTRYFTLADHTHHRPVALVYDVGRPFYMSYTFENARFTSICVYAILTIWVFFAIYELFNRFSPITSFLRLLGRIVPRSWSCHSTIMEVNEMWRLLCKVFTLPTFTPALPPNFRFKKLLYQVILFTFYIVYAIRLLSAYYG